MTREVLASGLVPSLIYLWDLFAHTFRLIHICVHLLKFSHDRKSIKDELLTKPFSSSSPPLLAACYEV